MGQQEGGDVAKAMLRESQIPVVRRPRNLKACAHLPDAQDPIVVNPQRHLPFVALRGHKTRASEEMLLDCQPKLTLNRPAQIVSQASKCPSRHMQLDPIGQQPQESSLRDFSHR